MAGEKLSRLGVDYVDESEVLTPADEQFHVDKHGGRNTYAAMLQDAVPDRVVVAHEESAGRSAYSVLGAGRDVYLTFQPRADARYFGVALASMVSSSAPGPSIVR